MKQAILNSCKKFGDNRVFVLNNVSYSGNQVLKEIEGNTKLGDYLLMQICIHLEGK